MGLDYMRPNKPDLVKNILQKVELGEVYTQKVREKFKEHSYFNAIHTEPNLYLIHH